MKPASQEDLTVQMLRNARERGVHTFEMRKAYIGNPSERIKRLQKRVPYLFGFL